MGTTALKQLLKSLCHDSCWNYAVVWKLRHGSPIILTWEDGCFDYPKPRKLVVNMLDGVSSHTATDVLQFEVSSSNCSYEETQIGNMAVDMSHLQYVFGEGVVGEVAVTGNHCWVSFSNIFGDEIHPELVPQCPDEWLLQFASGIKTILLVPILPHGVLQLGSLEEVPEDTEMVAFIKCRLNSLYRTGGNTITSSRDFKPQSPSSLVSKPIDTFNVPSTVAINLVKSEDLYPSMDINCNKLDSESFPETFEDERGSKCFSPSDIFPEVSPIGSMDSMQLEMVESKLFELSCLMGELQTYSDYNNDYAGGVFGESLNSIMNVYSSGDVEWKPTEFMAANNVTSVLSFPQDCELHKALGSAFWSQAHEKPWDTSFVERPYHSDRSNRAESPWVAKGCYAEDLLEPIVTNLYSGSDDTSSDMCDNSKSTSSPRFPTSSSQPPNTTDASALVEDESGPGSQVTSAFVVTRGTSSNATPAFMKDIMHTMFDKEHDGQEHNHIHSRKGQKISNTRRRAKPGNNHKPRPRDRQLIQDRVKELRELVPNGTKCSIDGLLDQTIKHMLYLRSVTEQAQKLGDWVDDEVSSRKDQRSCEAKDDVQTGTSLAFEFGSELQLCPIVVEDLGHPGHMLIEMLCNDHGLFLEIAQVIRDLQLTVLKGVMESRSNNTWAHFIVEACKGFHRLDIFWPLMQLLQRKTQPISSKI